MILYNKEFGNLDSSGPRFQWWILVNIVMNFWITEKEGNFVTMSFSRTLHHGINYL